MNMTEDAGIKFMIANINSNHDKLNNEVKTFIGEQKQINKTLIDNIRASTLELKQLIEFIKTHEEAILKLLSSKGS